MASTLSVRWCGGGELTTVQGPLPLSSLAVEVSGSSSACAATAWRLRGRQRPLRARAVGMNYPEPAKEGMAQ